MKDKTIVGTSTLITSLLTYLYAKEADKDVVPFVMIGGFIGSMIGEVIVEKVKENNNTKQ
jgi:uncharacterized membrane protein YfcA